VAACHLCGGQARLRFNRDRQQWECVETCGGNTTARRRARRTGRRREPLFDAWWIDTATGLRLRRASRVEMREAHRLWTVHADIRDAGAAQ
jgi:hypothetical protein